MEHHSCLSLQATVSPRSLSQERVCLYLPVPLTSMKAHGLPPVWVLPLFIGHPFSGSFHLVVLFLRYSFTVSTGWPQIQSPDSVFRSMPIDAKGFIRNGWLVQVQW